MVIERDRGYGLRRLLAQMLTSALVATGLVVGLGGPASAGTAPSFAALYTSGSDPILIEGNNLFVPGRDVFTVSGSAESGVQVDVADKLARYGYRMTFAAPAGQALVVGVYEQAQAVGTRDAGRPGIEITRGSTTCASTGRFEVLDLAPDLSHFWIVFEHLCAGQPAPAFGEVRHNLPSGPGLTVAAGRIAWPTATFDNPGRALPIRVTNYDPAGAVALTGSTLTGLGATSFSAYSGSCGSLSFNTSCYVTVQYRPVMVGPVEATLTLTDSAGGSTVVQLAGSGLQADDPGIVRAAGVPPGPVTFPGYEADYDEVALRWSNPTDIDWSDTVVRMAAGTTAPATITDGVELYTGRESGVQVTDLDPIAYSFSFFARDAEGFVAPPATITVGSSTVAVRADRTHVGYGQPVVLSGIARDSQTGAPLALTDLAIIAYDAVTDELYPKGTSRTDAYGEFQYGMQPGYTLTYFVVAAGDAGHLAGVSDPIEVKVDAFAALVAASKRGKLGTTFTMQGTGRPIDTTVPLLLQKQVKGTWKTVQKKKPVRKGYAMFKVEPTSKGKHKYRIVRPASPGSGKGTSKPVTVTVT